MNIEVIEETNDYVALIKPHGLHVIPDRYDASIPTLKSELERRFGRVFIIHRLDSGTGGVMIAARTRRFHKHANYAFEKGLVLKTYTALVRGRFSEPVTTMLPISARNQKGRYKINFKSGRSAVTSFIPKFIGDEASLVEAIPRTGRTHQIRVHLRALKYPLFQDFLYGEPQEDRRLTLFASTLEFEGLNGEILSFKAEPSDFMQEKIKEAKL